MFCVKRGFKQQIPFSVCEVLPFRLKNDSGGVLCKQVIVKIWARRKLSFPCFIPEVTGHRDADAWRLCLAPAP